MRIELNAGRGSSNTKATISAFVSSYTKLVNKTRNVAASFKAVESKVHNMSGGAGELQSAVNDLENRIKKTDEPKAEKLENAGQRFAMFVVDTINVDRAVGAVMNASNKKFYNENPWAVPPKPKKKPWWKKIGDWFSSVGKKIANAFTSAVKWIADKVKKAWNATVKFLKEHYKTILKVVGGAILIAGLFALSAVTGGAAAPVFALAAKAALTAALTSAATSVVSGIVQGKSAGEIFDSAGSSFFKGAVTGAVSGAIGGVGPSVLEATGSAILSKGAQILAEGAGEFLGGMITEGAEYLEKNGTLSGFFGSYAENAGMNVLASMAGSALGEAGGWLKDKAGGWLKERAGGIIDQITNSPLGKSFGDMIGSMKDKMNWLTSADGPFGKLGLTGLGDIAGIFKDPAGFAKGLGEQVISQITGGASVSDLVSSGLSQISDAIGVKDILGNLSFSGIVDSLRLPDLSGIINPSGVMGALGDAKDALMGFGSSIIDKSKDAVTSLCGSGFADAISSSVKQVNDYKDKVTGLVSSVTGAGKALGLI